MKRKRGKGLRKKKKSWMMILHSKKICWCKETGRNNHPQNQRRPLKKRRLAERQGLKRELKDQSINQKWPKSNSKSTKKEKKEEMRGPSDKQRWMTGVWVMINQKNQKLLLKKQANLASSLRFITINHNQKIQFKETWEKLQRARFKKGIVLQTMVGS